MSFENFNFDNAGATDPEFRMETVNAETAAQRLLVEYGINPNGEPTGGPVPVGEQQQDHFPSGVAAVPLAGPPAGTTPARPSQPSAPPTITQPGGLLQPVGMDRDELIQALQRGDDPSTAYAQFQQRRGMASSARAAHAPAPPTLEVHQQVLGVPAGGGTGLPAPQANVHQVVQHGGMVFPHLPAPPQVPTRQTGPAATTTGMGVGASPPHSRSRR